MKINPELDLVLERIIDVRPSLVWLAWTRPEHLVHWFTPAPWKTVACEIDLRPGGRFHTVMQSPEGEDHRNDGAYLEVVPEKRLVWTNAVVEGFRPNPERDDLGFRFTAHVLIEPAGKGTKYTAVVMHAEPAAKKKHEAMGFFEGWGAACDQLVAHMQGVERSTAQK